jgi:sugar phosphate isomerase/epimerase
MRVGLLIDPIVPDLSYGDNLTRAAGLGFEVVQLWYRDMVAESGGNPADIVSLLKDLGLELKSLAAYTDVLDPKRTWDEIFGELKEAIDFASRTGVRYVVTESGGEPGALELWGELIRRFSQLVSHAASRGVILLVENGPGVLVNDIELMVRLMSDLDSSHVGINFDPANLLLVPDDVIRAVQVLGAHIRDTHAKDAILLEKGSRREVPEEHVFAMPEGEEFIHLPEDVQWVLPPVGEGDVPFENYMDALTGIGFEGDLIIEFQGGGNREEAVVKSREYLKRLLQGGTQA